MRKIDFQRDQQFYNLERKAPTSYKEDLLDLYRFKLLLKLGRAIYKNVSLFSNKSVLNVASGYGREAHLILSERPKFIVLCDYSLEQIKQAREYLGNNNTKFLLCVDGENLPFKDKSFDICYITEALHHFIHPQRGIEEFLRVSRKAVIIDEPSGAVVRRILNRLFILLSIKKEYERGYLEAFRINREMFKDLSLRYKLDIIFYPYFIYYFEWYKKRKSQLTNVIYKNFLSILNIFFHSFGNRAIVILFLNKSRI